MSPLRLRLGREQAQKGGLSHGKLGREALERAKNKEKGQAGSSNAESSSRYTNRQSPAPLLLPCRAEAATLLPAFGTSAPAGTGCSRQTSPAVTAVQSNPEPGAGQSGPLPSLPPDLQLQLQDLCSSCSLPEGTRLLGGVTSSHTPFSPQGTSKSSQDFQKNPLTQATSPPAQLVLFFHCPR